MTNTKIFQFEADFVNNLRCIPMVVRYKLDTCGIKLKLSHWNHFNLAEREALVDLPCTT
ncbi:MAG: nitrate reductase associated protein, partial [Phormidium sp.]